jgi:HK97 family phage prohead protease
MTMRETRAVTFDQAEVRKADDGGLTFTGHAAVFNQRTWIGPKKWGFYEEVSEGFFDDVLDDRAAFLVNHDPNILLARNGSTMSLSVDDKGLVPEARWDPTDPDAIKWAGRVRRGDANEMSFAFTVKEESWSEDEAGNEVRTLLKADRLYDVSLVTYPAYEGTDGGMRDQAAEVVKRHRGFDPRVPQVKIDSEGGVGVKVSSSGRSFSWTRNGPASTRVGAEGTAEPAPVPTEAEPPAPAPDDTPVVADEPIVQPVVERHALMGLRHRANASRWGFTRDITSVGPLNEVLDDASQGGTDEDGGEDEDFSTDVGFISEIIENAQDSVAAAVEYLAESDPAVRNAAVVTFAQNLIRDLNAQVTTISRFLA